MDTHPEPRKRRKIEDKENKETQGKRKVHRNNQHVDRQAK